MTYPLSDDYCTRFGVSKPDHPYVTGNTFIARSHILLQFRDKVTPSDFLPTDLNLVAKIYDPLNFSHIQDDMDPFLCVDRDYSRETATYTALSKSNLPGTVIPRYFGSYTLQWPVTMSETVTTRSVRLILIEYVPGASLQQLNPADFSQQYRKTLMKAVIDAKTLLYTHGVQHRDLHPRNILVLNDTVAKASDAWGIRIVDFGHSVLGRAPFLELEGPEHLPGVPISPLLRWHKAWRRFEFFSDWIDWDWQSWLECVYGHMRASLTEHMVSTWLPAILTEPREVFIEE
ncbi:conserved hypothetical protein [Histoplasma capsulatum H143]|uniref:Protein kinase domain-containing protein n=1 Tax=Ajellomyces capsulatus (strain H143) TaxID=544712 RepID=C6HKB3_AJECH|nr:conserved hypothetical protein [Histoplasma capsulatum H143]